MLNTAFDTLPAAHFHCTCGINSYSLRPYRADEMQEEWTEKYRPKSLTDVVGNENAVRAMKRWAESWSRGIPHKKALVLMGEPGTGKTSSALALAHDLGWDIVEMNASDHRNADSIKRVAGQGAVSQTFTLDGEFKSTSQGRMKLIVLDEADNLFGREDYGGAKAIVEVIKESSQPLILIVNDYYELTRKASSLKSLSESIVFRRLEKRTIVAVLTRIASVEGVSIEKVPLESIADNAAGDLRAAVNDLQMLVEGRTEVVSDDTSVLSDRNQVKALSESLDAMFGSATVKAAKEATDGLDKTPDELEKWIEDGITVEMTDPEDMARAFDALSRADVYLGRTRKFKYYGFWSYARTLMTGGVAISRRSGKRRRAGEYRIPSQFIVLSRAKGATAARRSLKEKLSPQFHTSGKSFNDSVLPSLVLLARREKDLLHKLAVDADLDEGDISYLLGRDADSPEVASVMARARSAKGGEEEGKARKPRPASRGRRLGDF